MTKKEFDERAYDYFWGQSVHLTDQSWCDFSRMENKSWQNVWFGVAMLFENFVTNNQQNVNM